MIVGYYKNYWYTTDKVSSEKKIIIIMRSPSICFRTPKPVQIRQSGRTRIGGVTECDCAFRQGVALVEDFSTEHCSPRRGIPLSGTGGV